MTLDAMADLEADINRVTGMRYACFGCGGWFIDSRDHDFAACVAAHERSKHDDEQHERCGNSERA